MKITFWSDFACPFCYIGEARLKKAIAALPALGAVELERKAFQLDPDAGTRPACDNRTRFARKYGLSPEEADRQIAQISAMGRAEGLDLRFAGTLFTNTMNAHRLTKLAQSKGNPALTGRLTEALYRAYFTENRILADRALLLRLGADCGLDPAEAGEMLSGERYRAEVRADEREAARYGIRAVPFFVVGRWGIPGAVSTEDMKRVLSKAAEEAVGGDAPEGAACDPDGCRRQ